MLPVPLCRQGPVKPSSPVHVLSWLPLRHGPDATDISSLDRLPFGGIKTYRNAQLLHHRYLIVFYHLLYTAILSLVFLALMLLCDSIHEVRHDLLPLLLPHPITPLRRIPAMPLPRR